MQSWRDDAACRQIGGDLWFPIGDDDTNYPDLKRALSICQTLCPVRQECLRACMAEEKGKPRLQRHGIRGGLLRGQRYELERAMSA